MSAPLPDVTVREAVVVEGDSDLPAYCLVSGVIHPSIGFEMRLPVEGWNKRFLLAGCGAYCGQVQPPRPDTYANSIKFAVRRGYAATTTDSGHQTSSPVDTSWAYNNPEAETLYAHAWVPRAAAASRSIIQAYYGQSEQRAYFSGCSNGGRTATKVAQLYPTLFDGIASGAPGINATYAAGVLGIWWDRILVDSRGQLRLTAERVPILAEAVLDHCDAKDGQIDRLISDPSACDFKPESLQCTSDEDRVGCLTADEVEVATQLYAGPTDSQGRQIYPGVPFGSEKYWTRWLVGPTDGGRPHVASLGSNFLRYLGFAKDPGPTYDSSQFDLDKDIPKLAEMGALYNATNPDLTGLQRSGGKLLMYHGLADALTVPDESTRYFHQVVGKIGSESTVNDFYRLFLVPGMDHCWGATGHAPDIFDPVAVLEEWVEKGNAPEKIVAKQYVDPRQQSGEGPVFRTRPACLYPKRAQYVGKGSPYSAANYACVDPGESRKQR